MTETPSSTERPLDSSAIALVLLLCLTWGFNQVVVKLLLPEIPPLTQAFLRSLAGFAVILLVALVRRVCLLRRDGTLRAGLWAGTLFGIEFIFLYSGLLWTTASRASVFLYTAPFFVAFGSYRYLGERLSRLQWAGLALSFVGVAVAIGVPQPNVDAKVMLGDAFMIAAGSLWGRGTRPSLVRIGSSSAGGCRTRRHDRSARRRTRARRVLAGAGGEERELPGEDHDEHDAAADAGDQVVAAAAVQLRGMQLRAGLVCARPLPRDARILVPAADRHCASRSPWVASIIRTARCADTDVAAAPADVGAAR